MLGSPEGFPALTPANWAKMWFIFILASSQVSKLTKRTRYGEVKMYSFFTAFIPMSPCRRLHVLSLAIEVLKTITVFCQIKQTSLFRISMKNDAKFYLAWKRGPSLSTFLSFATVSIFQMGWKGSHEVHAATGAFENSPWRLTRLCEWRVLRGRVHWECIFTRREKHGDGFAAICSNQWWAVSFGPGPSVGISWPNPSLNVYKNN